MSAPKPSWIEGVYLGFGLVLFGLATYLSIGKGLPSSLGVSWFAYSPRASHYQYGGNLGELPCASISKATVAGRKLGFFLRFTMTDCSLAHYIPSTSYKLDLPPIQVTRTLYPLPMGRGSSALLV